jgi:hypothetical protein
LMQHPDAFEWPLQDPILCRDRFHAEAHRSVGR